MVVTETDYVERAKFPAPVDEAVADEAAAAPFETESPAE